MNTITNFAPQPLLRIDVDRDGGVSALGDAAAAAGVAISQMRPVLNNVEGTAIGADYTLSKRIGHAYTSFSGAWSELVTGIGRVDGAGVRRMVSVLRRKLLCTPGRSPGFEAATCCLCRASSFPGLTAEWMFGDSSSFTVAGPHRDCTGLPFSALAGTLGLQ
jgi:hypothetical protein